MKLKELQEILKGFLERGERGDLNAVVPLKMPSMGPSPSCSIISVHWDSNSLFLTTEKPLTIKTDKEFIFDAAYDLIFYLATKPGKRQSYETRTARRILNYNGISDEELSKFTNLYHGKK